MNSGWQSRDPGFAKRAEDDRMRVEYGREIMRQVIIYPGEDGQWVAECPRLPGCISQGKTKEEALTNIREAIRGYIGALEEDNLPVPEDRLEAVLVAV